LYTGLRLDYRLRLWAPTSASRAISAVAELLVCFVGQLYGAFIALLSCLFLTNKYKYVYRLWVRWPWRDVLLTETATWLLWRQRPAHLLCHMCRCAWHTRTCQLSVRRQGIVVSPDTVSTVGLLLISWYVLRDLSHLPQWSAG